jgi:hypothetical protein
MAADYLLGLFRSKQAVGPAFVHLLIADSVQSLLSPRSLPGSDCPSSKQACQDCNIATRSLPGPSAPKKKNATFFVPERTF